jgi:indolepyruvate ferredoxin oxidoreductase alpha subunit
MKQVLTADPETRLLLLGNEAIVRGALEAGVGFVTTYPGTPASEIGDAFAEIAHAAGIYFEYSVNEKVALEMAGAAAVSGVRALCAMKHVGLNVAADAFISLAYTGVRAGLVIVSADDPAMHSSQNEQDNRYYARWASVPMLEPHDPQEALRMAREAFELSERLELPVLLRTTTRVSHTRGVVIVGQKIRDFITRGTFVKDPSRFVILPAVARQRHEILRQRMELAQELSERSPLHEIVGEGNELGIVTSGVAFNYVLDAVEELGVFEDVAILKLGMTNPLPRALCEAFFLTRERILVVEELEPYLEDEIKGIVADLGIQREILGKATGHFSRLYELTPDHVIPVIAKLLAIPRNESTRRSTGEQSLSLELPARPPVLCPGCPHRATYDVIQTITDENVIFSSDIGCYTLGGLPPYQMADFLLCMGSSVGTAGGFSKVTGQKVIAFIGDSTFFHAGIPALVNAVHNDHKFLLVILDNQTTAMTGHQPHPGVQANGTTPVSIEAIVRACGVKNVCVIDPYDYEEAALALRDAWSAQELSVVISRHICPLAARKRRSYEEQPDGETVRSE